MELPEEFLEILDGEFVDRERLAVVSSYGIPEAIREDVYRILLGINVQTDQQDQEYALEARKGKNSDVIKRIRGEVNRFYSSRSSIFKDDVVRIMENIVSAYFYAHSEKEYSASAVYITGPLVYLFKKEAQVYQAFDKIMAIKDEYFTAKTMSERISDFMMLFKLFIPDLFKHFEEEEVDIKEFLKSWFSSLLAKELPLDCVLRLWDVYLTHSLGLELHVYSCLAILLYFKETFEDFDDSDIRSAILKLPPLDMDHIISEARRLRIEVAGLDDQLKIESSVRSLF